MTEYDLIITVDPPLKYYDRVAITTVDDPHWCSNPDVVRMSGEFHPEKMRIHFRCRECKDEVSLALPMAMRYDREPFYCIDCRTKP